MQSRPVVAKSFVSRALLCVGVLLLEGCNDDKKGGAASTTTSAITAAPSSPSSAPDATAAVLDGYRKFWDAYLAAADPMEPEHPLLAQHATGEELETVQKAFLASQVGGEVIRGRLDLAPRIVSVNDRTAMVSDCYADHTNVFDARTGAQKDKSSGVRHLVLVTLVLEDGTWKVADLKHEGDGCTPG